MGSCSTSGVQVFIEQGGGTPVEFIGAPVDVRQLFRDVAQIGKVGPSPIPRPLRVSQAAPRSLRHRNGRRLSGLDIVALADGEMPVCPQIPGQQIPHPAGQRVRGECCEGRAGRPTDRSAETAAPRAAGNLGGCVS